MSDLASVKVIIHGRVQGVFFRDFTTRRARGLDLVGYVLNLPSGAVEVVAEGEREHLKSLIRHISRGPVGALVSRVETDWSEYSGKYSDFSTRFLKSV